MPKHLFSSLPCQPLTWGELKAVIYITGELRMKFVVVVIQGWGLELIFGYKFNLWVQKLDEPVWCLDDLYGPWTH